MTFPDFDMALLGPNGFVAGWADPGTDIKADVQAMMAKWERDALVLGIEVDWPHDLVTRLTALLALPEGRHRRHWRRYLAEPVILPPERIVQVSGPERWIGHDWDDCYPKPCTCRCPGCLDLRERGAH